MEQNNAKVQKLLTTVGHCSKDVLLRSRSNSCIVSWSYSYSVKTGIKKMEKEDFRTVELC